MRESETVKLWEFETLRLCDVETLSGNKVCVDLLIKKGDFILNIYIPSIIII